MVTVRRDHSTIRIGGVSVTTRRVDKRRNRYNRCMAARLRHGGAEVAAWTVRFGNAFLPTLGKPRHDRPHAWDCAYVLFVETRASARSARSSEPSTTRAESGRVGHGNVPTTSTFFPQQRTKRVVSEQSEIGRLSAGRALRGQLSRLHAVATPGRSRSTPSATVAVGPGVRPSGEGESPRVAGRKVQSPRLPAAPRAAGRDGTYTRTRSPRKHRATPLWQRRDARCDFVRGSRP